MRSFRILNGSVLTLLSIFGLTSFVQGQVATTTQLVIPVPTVAVGVPTLLTATVTDAASHGVHLGTVTFYDGTRSLGSVQIVSGTSGAYPQGTANLKTASFALGANSITAVFAGTTSDLKSTSSAKTVTVTGKNLTTTALSGYVTGTDFWLPATLRAFGSDLPTGDIEYVHEAVGPIASKSLIGTPWKLDLSISDTAALGGSVTSNPNGVSDVVAVGDFDGDGVLDLATTYVDRFGSPFVGVLVGNGDGTFKSPVSYQDTNGNPTSIYAADFNNDGRLDLAVVNYFNSASIKSTIGILYGNGDGTFQPQVQYGGEVGVDDAYVGDVNGDGNLDVVYAGGKNQAGTVAVLLGKGDGTFQAQVAYALSPGFGPHQVFSGDINGDGIPDLAVNSTNGLNILLGKGDGTFLSPSVYVLGLGAGFQVALADVNGDGKLDLVWSQVVSVNIETFGETGIVGVALGKGDGTFEIAQTYPLAGDPGPPLVVDLNQDGKMDIVLGAANTGVETGSETGSGNTTDLLIGNGDGTFQNPVTYLQNLNVPLMIPAPISTGDFNGDGRSDLVTPNISANALTTALNGLSTSVVLAKEELGPGTTTVNASYSGDTAFAVGVSNTVKLSPNATPAPSYPSGFANTANLLFNGSALVRTASTFGNGVLLTDGGPNEAGSIYYAAPQNVQAFTTDFAFDICCEVTEADGLTFTIQNEGPEALGSAGGGMGYKHIAQSVAIKFDFYNNSGEGNGSTGLYIDGASPDVPAVDMTSSDISLAVPTEPFNVHITYDGDDLTLTIVDLLSKGTFSHSWAIDIPATVGGTTAYVGFTGATGGRISTDEINSWTYIPGAH